MSVITVTPQAQPIPEILASAEKMIPTIQWAVDGIDLTAPDAFMHGVAFALNALQNAIAFTWDRERQAFLEHWKV